MTSIGLAGAGTIGSGLIHLMNTSPAARSLRLKAVLVRDIARPRPGIPAGSTLVPLILTTHCTTRGRLDLVLAALATACWRRSVVLRIQDD